MQNLLYFHNFGQLSETIGNFSQLEATVVRVVLRCKEKVVQPKISLCRVVTTPNRCPQRCHNGANMDILFILIILHLAWYSPQIIYIYEQKISHIQKRDTVSKPEGIPYYYMGNFVRYLEN